MLPTSSTENSALSSVFKVYNEVWLPASQLIAEMVQTGVALDRRECLDQEALHGFQLDETEKALNDNWGERNWGSPVQVANLLYDEWHLEIPPVAGNLKARRATETGERPTSEAALVYLKLQNPDLREFFELLAERKKTKKLLEFFKLLPEYAFQGRIHCSYGIARTGRWLAKLPNLQQLPPACRGVIIEESPYLLLVFDEKALEWRLLGHRLVTSIGDDQILREIQSGTDPHQATAASLGIPRADGKVFNYAVLYGKGDRGKAIQLGISLEESKELSKLYAEARPGIIEYQKLQVKQARRLGYITSLLGRRRRLNYTGHPRLDAGEDRKAKNVMQLDAADVLAIAMGAIYRESPGGFQALLNVHDELVFRAETTEHTTWIRERLTTTVENRLQLRVPLEVTFGVGNNWKTAGGK